MKIELTDIGIQDATAILQNLAAIGMNSETPAETLTSLFEVIGSLAAAIRQEMEAIA